MMMKRLAVENPLLLITPSEAEAVSREVLARVSANGKATVNVAHHVTVRTRFANNKTPTMESEDTLDIRLVVNLDGKAAIGGTSRTDTEGLVELVRTTEEAARANEKDSIETGEDLAPPATFADPRIYFDASVNAGASKFQGDVARNAAARAAAAGLIAAGTVEVTAGFLLVMNSAGFRGHTRNTYGEFAMTARTKDGKGSGWAWAGGEDFSHVDPEVVVERSVDLCQRSDKPVAVEPGRYTVILEPEAVAQLMATVTGDPTRFMSAFLADEGVTAYSKKEGGNKIGLKMADERVEILYDPEDPDLPFSPLNDDGSLFSRTHWFERGILTNLAWDPWYASRHNRKPLGNPLGRAKLDIAGSKQTLEQMIASTKRGIWVHHFTAVAPLNDRTLLLTGVTRDGTFLIENGKVAKAIKNLRFNESPFFFLNKLDAFGPSGRASANWAAPRLKVHDFEFTSLSDAV